ncbi:hypothetical protein C0991_000256 [Blastosporella zonata]|nr:hypothetical protein C0991_000256 [Blastosporella zonata]
MAAPRDHDDGTLPVLLEKAPVKQEGGRDSNSDNFKEASVQSLEAQPEDDDAVYLDGEPVVTTGRDVSRFVVDVRDDGEAALTFRSLFLGTVMAGLGAALCQVRFVFFILSDVIVLNVLADILVQTGADVGLDSIPAACDIFLRECMGNVPTAQVLGRRHTFPSPWPYLRVRQSRSLYTERGVLAFDVITSYELIPNVPQHVVASLVASTAAYGSTAVLNFAVQRLYYDTHVEALTAVLATFSTACFGYGLTGVLRPLTVYPSEMVYWGNLPNVAVFQALHFDATGNGKRVKLFWTAFVGMFTYEVLPAYIFPLLNGINVFCLASQHASQKTIDVFTNLFGGTDGNEGLGLLSLSFDWQYIGSSYMFENLQPLISAGANNGEFTANSWVGYVFCYITIMAIYYSNTWNSLAFPMLSTSIFSANGSIYEQSAVFGTTFQLNQTALEEVGLPALTGSNAWTNLTANLSIGGLIAHVLLFWGPYAVDSFKLAASKMQPDPHYQQLAMTYGVPLGLIVVLKGQTTLPWWSYIVALILGAFITPFSTLLYARMGNGVATNQLMKMVAGAINPGRPVANLYVRMVPSLSFVTFHINASCAVLDVEP